MGLSTHTNRTPTAHHHNHAMNEFIHPGSGVCPLNDWAVMAFDGPDATSFLQGQLTQDVASLAPDQARLGGYCSAKGRLMATGVLWRPQPDSICWAIPAALLPGLQKRLQMFVLRAKVKIRDADLPLWGIAAEATSLPVWGCQTDEHGSTTRLPDSLGQTRLLRVGSEPTGPALPRAAWDWLELHAGQPWVQVPTSEHFVPQMLNWELLGGVNFKKGCYPGQEVVARSQYRGTIKRRTHLFLAPAAAPVGTPVLHSDDPGQPAGEVVGCATWAGQTLVLAEVKLAALESGQLYLAAADGTPQGAPLRQLPLPYAITAPE